MQNIYNFTLTELEDYFISINDKKFRATQIYDFLYKKRNEDIDTYGNIPNNIKEVLKKEFSFYKIKIIDKQEDEGVKKYLFELEDNNHIESVIMYHDYGISICVSS